MISRISKHSLILLLILPLSLFAKIEGRTFQSPEQEALYLTMTQELRCLVCQNQNIADSNADLATDLRDKTYEMIVAGKSREDIVDYMTARYGDFVLYKPPVKKITYLLWGGPFIFILLSLLVLLRLIRSKRAGATDQGIPVSAEELDKARQLLK